MSTNIVDANLVDHLSNLLSLKIDDQIKAAATILGYKKLPPTIEEFIEDDYYLGRTYSNQKLYPFWKEKLMEIFPSPIHTASYIVVLKGGIGTGKSTVAKIMALYNLCRLDHLKNAHDTLRLAKGKYLDFNFFSASNELAISEFIDPLISVMSDSPYFSGGMINKPPYTFTTDGVRGNNAISKDVIFFNLSELNFVARDVARRKLNSALKRWDSRFGHVKGYFGNIILDSSSRGDDAIVEEFVKDNPYGEHVKVINANQWKVREHMNMYGRKGWFYVYAGDSINRHSILPENFELLDTMDPDRVIKVPMELYPDFKFDLTTALQDKAGISTKSSGVLYSDTTNLKACFTLPMYTEDVIKVDFYDKMDKLIYKVDRYLYNIPRDKILFIRYDIGVTGDNCGLAICYFDKFVRYDEDSNIMRPTFKVPVALAINRYAGQETPINHLYEFIKDLSNEFEIGMFTADQFASRQLLQDLTRDEIAAKYLSVDRTDEAYIYLKNLTNNNLIEIANNKLLFNELASLKHIDGKVDHPGDGSKDISDAVSGAVFSCYQNIDLAGKLSSKYNAETLSDHMKIRLATANSVNDYERMISGIFN